MKTWVNKDSLRLHVTRLGLMRLPLEMWASSKVQGQKMNHLAVSIFLPVLETDSGGTEQLQQRVDKYIYHTWTYIFIGSFRCIGVMGTFLKICPCVYFPPTPFIGMHTRPLNLNPAPVSDCPVPYFVPFILLCVCFCYHLQSACHVVQLFCQLF